MPVDVPFSKGAGGPCLTRTLDKWRGRLSGRRPGFEVSVSGQVRRPMSGQRPILEPPKGSAPSGFSGRPLQGRLKLPFLVISEGGAP